jgi:gamma-glutamylcyclotransferase (GGCT)/AIG2-like uncharacterized protein YtfP
MVQDSSAVSRPEAKVAEHYVFVYGTLRRGGSNDINLRKPAPRYVGSASLQGSLYDLGPYPGLVLAPAGSRASEVIGELYAISLALEENLDELEGLLPVPTGEYFKRWMRIEVASGDLNHRLDCIVYEINPERTHASALISSGDWMAHWTEKTSALATARQAQGRDSAK